MSRRGYNTWSGTLLHAAKPLDAVGSSRRADSISNSKETKELIDEEMKMDNSVGAQSFNGVKVASGVSDILTK